MSPRRPLGMHYLRPPSTPIESESGDLGGLVLPRAGSTASEGNVESSADTSRQISHLLRCARWPQPSAPGRLPHLHLWQEIPWFKWAWTLGLIVEVTLTVSTPWKYLPIFPPVCISRCLWAVSRRYQPPIIHQSIPQAAGELHPWPQ